MIYYESLADRFFKEYPRDANGFYALSGYLGPSPLVDLKELGIPSKVIFGLGNEGIKSQLLESLREIHEPNQCEILVPSLKSHSKCYLWLKDDQPLKGLMGSANFSGQGLYTDFRESLMDVNSKELFILKGYMDLVLSTTVPVTEWVPSAASPRAIIAPTADGLLELYDVSTGEVQPKHGLNWGMASLSGSHVNIDDACIAIRTSHIQSNPELFPKRMISSGSTRGNLDDVIDIIWDDGVNMKAKFEGTQGTGLNKFPKQVASFPKKKLLGQYLRKRIGVPSGVPITRKDLNRYGRNGISVELINEGVYYFDFRPLR